MNDPRGRGRPANPARQHRRRLGAVRDRVAILTAHHEANGDPVTDRRDLVVDQTARHRDAAHDIGVEIRSAARLAPRDPEPTRRVEARGDVDHAALEVGQTIDEQHDDIDQRKPEVVRDLDVIAAG